MLSVEILATGRLDDRESAFPQAVQLPNGDILCSFSVGGGPYATGGTDWARSTDDGQCWTPEGTILPMDGNSTNALKLSLSADSHTIYAYGSRSYSEEGVEGFGSTTNEPVLCVSSDGGLTWSAPRAIPMKGHAHLEISHGILPLQSGRILAPAATLDSQDTLGKQVLVAISDDNGRTWPRHAVVFEDPDGVHGYFEQKLAEVRPGLLIATCWTMVMDGVKDRENSFTLSNDGGETWSTPRSTGIMGQTMTPIPLGDNRLLVLYNRRYGDQGIVMALVTFTDEKWITHYDGILYDACSSRARPSGLVTGVDELTSFQFGFPTAIRLRDHTYLTTHWSQENGRFGIRWTLIRVDWGAKDTGS